MPQGRFPDVAARLEAAEERIGFRFTDRDLLRRALTHPSFAAEDPEAREPYERLEFLGDAVLSFVVADHLFRAFQDQPEGVLTKLRISLVAGTVLSQVAEDIGLADVMLVGKTASAGRQRALEDCFEAVVAALYLDAGIEAARSFALKALAPRIDLDAASRLVGDPKTALQELTQAQGRGLPTYRIVSEEGPPHQRTFVAEVVLGGETLGAGVGASKKDAEKRAAEEALEALDGR